MTASSDRQTDPTRTAPGEIGLGQRATGFLRNLGQTVTRAGWLGVLELLAARAAPALIAYERTTIIDTPLEGRAHPEFEPRRLVAPDAEADELFARLAATGEPEVPAFSPAMMRRRFASGHELWLFSVDGQPAHARWIVRDSLRLVGLSIPLPAGYCTTEAAVTLPEFRGRRLHGHANEHLRAVLGGDGTRGMFSAINGFNRRLLAWTLSPAGGACRVATVHTLSFAGRRWLRVVSHSGALADVGLGMATHRWVSSTRLQTEDPGRAWDRAAEQVVDRPYLDPRMGQAKRDAHVDLLERWLPDLETAAVLKTDLWEEGVTGDELLFTLARRARAAAGVDISEQVTALAREAAAREGVRVELASGSLASLPFADGLIDAIVSTSTIDHLSPDARLPALTELRRVLAPGGVLVLTADNSDNVGDRLLGLCSRLGLVPFPLEAPVTLGELRELVTRAGFAGGVHAFLVPGPRVLTTIAIRAARMLPGRSEERAVDALMSGLEATGRRWPRKTGAFVALRATA